MGLIILKRGAESGLPVSILNNKVHYNLNPYTLIGLTLYGISFVLYVYLISKYDLGYIIPVLAAFVYILIFLASFVLFKEVFTATKVMGICLIVVGLILINIKS